MEFPNLSSNTCKQRTGVELCVSSIDFQSNQDDNSKVHDTNQKKAFINIKLFTSSFQSVQINNVNSIQYIGWEVNITCQPPISKLFKFEFSGNDYKYK